MEYETNQKCGEFVNIILSSTIEPTPNQSDEGAMYAIGENIIFVMIQYDKNKNATCVRIIDNSGNSKKYTTFNNPEDAKSIDDACKKRLKTQIDEQAKIEQKLRLERRLEKEQRKAQQFKLRFGLDSNKIKR